MKRTLSAMLAFVMLLGCFAGLVAADDVLIMAPTSAQVPVIDNPSADTKEAAVILNPTGVKPAAPTELTMEQKQEMIVQTALAYYYQNPYVQYDGNEVTLDESIQRHDDYGEPEDAAIDSQVYSVCSNYCYKCYYGAFEYRILGLTYGQTKRWSTLPATDPIVVYKYNGDGGEQDIVKAMRESREILQPGDIITGYGNTSGHAMLFVGDCFGDGEEYILHCWGGSYKMDTGLDRPEPEGSIKLQTVDECCYADGPSPNWYLAEDSHSALGFCILRPLQDPKFPATATATAVARLQTPNLKITRELDRTKFEAAQNGEEIPVYVTVSNMGSTTHNEVTVEEYLSEGQTLVEGSLTKGAKVEGDTITWAVKLPAGTSITLTYKVKVSGKLGDTITFKHGSVAGIPSRQTTLVIGGEPLTEDQKAYVMEYAKKMTASGKPAKFKDLQFFNDFYQGCFGVELGLPATTQEWLDGLVKNSMSTFRPLEKIALEDAALRRMILPLHLSGQAVANKDNWDRVRDYNEVFYQPGDMFICLEGNSKGKVRDTDDIDLYIYLGGSRLLKYNSEEMRFISYDNSIAYVLRYNLTAVLRPTNAYANLMNRVPSKMAFTDVETADWYYTYVKDLVYDGTVNGMTDTTFAPNGKLTYGQALKLVTLAVGEKEQAAVAGGHWASGYEKLAKEKGWLTETVSMDKEITRLQFCQIAAKAAGLTGAPAKNPFTDCSDAGVLALNNAGVINGMTETTFAPNQPLTRAQIAKIVWCLREAA